MDMISKAVRILGIAVLAFFVVLSCLIGLLIAWLIFLAIGRAIIDPPDTMPARSDLVGVWQADNKGKLVLNDDGSCRIMNWGGNMLEDGYQEETTDPDGGLKFSASCEWKVAKGTGDEYDGDREYDSLRLDLAKSPVYDLQGSQVYSFTMYYEQQYKSLYVPRGDPDTHSGYYYLSHA
jgi:hypothetical protein